MLSAIPGLHLSTALPEDVRDAVRRAGEGGWQGIEEGKKEDTKGGEGGGEETMLVGDLVGSSPPVSGGLGGGKEGLITQVERERDQAEEDEDDSEYEEESYDGVVQSASVVVARPHPHTNPLLQLQSHLQAQPLTIPTLPRVIEPLKPVGRPRLVNVNTNGLSGAEQAKSSVERRGGDVDVGSDEPKVPTRENRDSIRSSTATIMPPSGPHGVVDYAGVSGANPQNGQGSEDTNERPHHRPPSMKLLFSNGTGHTRDSLGVESAMGTRLGTAITEGENATPFLSYYLGDTGTPSPLPSPGSALGSPLRDGPMVEGESLTPSTPYSASNSSRRFEFEDGYEYGYDEYRSSQNGGQNSRVGMSTRYEDDGDEDDIYADYVEEEKPPHLVRLQPRPLPSTTPTIILNDGAYSPANDDGDRTKPNNAVLNGVLPISTSSSATDLSDNSLSPAPSPFQQRYRGWVSTLVAPLSEFIDEAVDPRDHYLDLSEIAEGESGSVYAARVNRASVKKLRLGEVVRMQDLDDLGLRDDDDEDDVADVNDNGLGNEEKTKLVAIKSIALVPSGTPKLVDLQRELVLMKGLWHSHVLSVDAVYVDLVEDSVWLRMELMERSLADVIVLVESGLVLQERTIARFASDVSLFLFVMG